MLRGLFNFLHLKYGGTYLIIGRDKERQRNLCFKFNGVFSICTKILQKLYIYLHTSFYKNILYKKIEAEIGEILRIL